MRYKMRKKLFDVILFFVVTIGQTNGTRPKVISKPVKALTTRQGIICTEQDVGGFVKNPDDCRLFYFCAGNGQAILAACPLSMLFNPGSKLCDAPANVQCDMPATTEPSTSPPTTTASPGANEATDASRYCASLASQQDMNRIVFLGSSSSCQKYYICYYGQAILQECSPDLHWNSNIGKCDLPVNAACSMGAGNNGQTNANGNGQGSGTSQGNNGGQGNNAGQGQGNSGNLELINCPTYGQHIFPHMERCDLFIYCVKGHASLQRCPFYYNFDIVSKNCKWRTAAICVRDLNINFRKLTKV